MSRWSTFSAFLKEAQSTPENTRQALVTQLLAERPQFPWISDLQATFIYRDSHAQQVALNLDTIPSDPPFAPMQRLAGTDLWHVTREFVADDLLDYLFAVNDPMTPLSTDANLTHRVSQYWKADPLNPLQMKTATFDVSVLRMNHARPFPDWASFANIPHGNVTEHNLDDEGLDITNRKMWVYTPPQYAEREAMLPVLLIHDGQWANRQLQVPAMIDTLIKHGRMQPALVAMLQSDAGEARNREYLNNPLHTTFLLEKVIPKLNAEYRVDNTRITTLGVSSGAAASAAAAIAYPEIFSRVAMISPPLGKGSSSLNELQEAWLNADVLPKRVFQSVGRYEAKGRFYRPAQLLQANLSKRDDVVYRFIETGSGHGLVGFRGILPEALVWILPGIAYT